MFRFTIRDVLGLTAIAGVCCVVGPWVAPADPVSDMIASVFLFLFGGACYVGGLAVARYGQKPNNT
jgi:drug/metabolite transporter (DMT)-like permease